MPLRSSQARKIVPVLKKLPNVTSHWVVDVLSRLFFEWVSPFMLFGYRCRLLAQHHLLKLPKSLDTTATANLFSAVLSTTVQEGVLKV